MEWKYSKLKNLNLDSFVPSFTAESRPNHDQLAELASRLTGATYNIVLLNGILDPTLSTLDVLPKELTVKKSEKKFEDKYPDRFTDAHGSLSGQGLQIELAESSSLPRPVKIVFFNSQATDGRPLLIQPKIFIKVGSRSKLSVVTESWGPRGQEYFVNSRLEIDVKDSGNLEFVQTSEESEKSFHLTRYNYKIGLNSQVTSLFQYLESGTARLEVSVPVNHAHIDHRFYAMGLLKNKNQVDIQTEILHNSGESSTKQICKFIADDESRAIFGGKVVIAKNAQKTNIEQLNQNLLLSSKAEIDSEPQLEIDADDVKASHGSTIGSLDPEEVFYLQSRAIPKKTALKILSFGFLNEVIQQLENETLKSTAENSLRKYLQGGI
ncbi:MAG: SufD family Fe-S cluster assembly protein [Bdellovibrionota bacterium]